MALQKIPQPMRLLSGWRRRPYAWGWWFSADEEHYSGPHATRDDAVNAAFHENCGEDYKVDGMGSFHIIEARQGPLRLSRWIEADDVLQRPMESIDDEHGGEDGIDWDRCWTGRQERQLTRLVRLVVAAWEHWHGIEVRTYMFTHSRNAEWYTWHRRYPPAG